MARSPLSRRAALLAGAGALLATCRSGDPDKPAATSVDERGRPEKEELGSLRARPSTPPTSETAPGAHRLGLGGRRDGVLSVPPGYRPRAPAPLVVMFHGAGGAAAQSVDLLGAIAAERGLVVLAPDSRGATWDFVTDETGRDVSFVDAALASTFERVAVDRARVVAAGFSDGASYALSLGVANGDLFSHLVGFSPGFVARAEERGSPAVFVSHGTRDDVLPIDRCGRRVVKSLRRAGYDVDYQEFDGGHEVPDEMIRRAADRIGS